jgi:hypothetical protein
MTFETLRRPLSIDHICDGGAYVLPGLALAQTNLFLKIGCVDELFVKVPSERGLADYRRFIKLAESNPEDIRPLESAERFENLSRTRQDFPDSMQHMPVDRETLHYLAVHRLQYGRLHQQTAVRIPRAKFGVLGSSRFRFFRETQPAMFQERIAGTSLWDMFDFVVFTIKPQWRPSLPRISAQLSELLDSGLRDHIDWNIQNFLFNETDERLYYVDLKPSIYVARSSNERNLVGIRDYLIV